MAQFKPFRFFDEVKRETKKVTWPTWPETRVSTIMVFVMVTLASLFLFFADQIINGIVKFILGL
jgi:preprotein translocase subunit SecE